MIFNLARALMHAISWRKNSVRQRAKPVGRPRRFLEVEILESRDLLSVAVPDFIRFQAQSPLASSGSAAYTPAMIRQAYGFNQLPYTGSGETIAIIDAYDDPTIASDLHTFDTTFGLADPPSFRKVNENGGSTLPGTDPSGPGTSNWEGEIALDVEWVHAIAPGANILLVEANSNNFSDLLTAVNYAANQPGVVAVSMSWGGGEFSGESGLDGYFTTPSGHSGVTFVASSGDQGGVVDYPAASPNILSVGGTTLSTDSQGNYLSETAWSDSGGGVSTQERTPSFQAGLGLSGRGVPDVSYNADPNTGVYVYDSYDGGWFLYGGTSAAAPQWSALIALADQGRAQKGLAPLDGPTQMLPAIYSFSSADFHDVTTGTAGSHSAGPGYDLVTGRGTPVANRLIPDLIAYGTSNTPQQPVIGWQSLGQPAQQVVAATDPNGSIRLFAIGTDHAVWTAVQTTAGGPVGTWTNLGGYVTQIAVGNNSDGTLTVFGIGGDNAAWFRKETSTTNLSFTNWSSLGGYVKQLAAGRDGNGDLELFAIGGDNALWVDVQASPNNSSYRGWVSLGGYVTQITVGTNQSGALSVFGIGGDNGAWLRQQQNASGTLTWANWQSLGGYVKQLVVGRDVKGDLELFAIGGDNAVWQRVQNGANSLTYQGWGSLGGYVTQITVGQNADGTLDVLGIGGDQAAWYRKQVSTTNLTFNSWASLGGVITQIAVANNQNKSLQLFGIGSGSGAVLTNNALV